MNRLTRELSLLRQQTASVASTTSSTSTSVNDAIDPVHNSQYLSGSVHPTSARRHRSSSNLSARSFSGSTHAGVTAGAMSGSVNSIAPSREAGRPSTEMPRVNRSRDRSVPSGRQSGTSSPSLSSSLQHHGDYPAHSHSGGHSHAYSHSHSRSLSHRPSQNSIPIPIPNPPMADRHARSTSISSTSATARYEEVAHHRAELAAAKRENDALRRRVQELEVSLKERNQPSVSGEVGHSATSSSITSGLQEASLNETS